MVDTDVNDLRLAISRLATDHARHLEALLASATILEGRLAHLAALERVAATARGSLASRNGGALDQLAAALADLDHAGEEAGRG